LNPGHFFPEGTPLLRDFASTNFDQSGNPTDAAFTWRELSASFPTKSVWQSKG